MGELLMTDIRKEDLLKELNLYPLWKLRVSATSHEQSPENPKASAPVASTAALTVESQAAAADCSLLEWGELKKRVKACTACKLRAGCMQTVFGMGDEKADWLFVGSWPTEDDEAEAYPFAGKAGQLLDNMLVAIKLKRSVNVYLANVVKCSGSIKRGPQKNEIAQCLPYLKRQIQLLQPEIIVTLGHAAATTLLGEDREWNGLSGKIHDYIFHADDGTQQTIPLVVTHHPAALLLTPLNKAQVWNDLCLARDVMQKRQSGI